jgi:hypothetical protein
VLDPISGIDHFIALGEAQVARSAFPEQSTFIPYPHDPTLSLPTCISLIVSISLNNHIALYSPARFFTDAQLKDHIKGQEVRYPCLFQGWWVYHSDNRCVGRSTHKTFLSKSKLRRGGMRRHWKSMHPNTSFPKGTYPSYQWSDTSSALGTLVHLIRPKPANEVYFSSIGTFHDTPSWRFSALYHLLTFHLTFVFWHLRAHLCALSSHVCFVYVRRRWFSPT